MKSNNQKLNALVGTAILAALVIVLQAFVVIPIGIFFITLTLVPIIVGAILYGAGTGAFLGFVFGAAVSVQVVTGAAGVMSFMMFEAHPVITITLCILKGAAAGFVSGAVFSVLKQKRSLGVILSAIACPIVNTGIFIAGLFVFYYPLMAEFAAQNAFANVSAFIFVGVVGLNFVVEFAINVLLIPVVLRVIKIVMPSKR